MKDKNNNQVPDKIESYLLLIVSVFLIIVGIAGAGFEFLDNSFATWIVALGVGGLLGDEFVKTILLRK